MDRYSQKNEECTIDEEFASIISSHLLSLGWDHDYCFTGYTEMALHVGEAIEQFRFADSYHGASWYDWCLVEYHNPKHPQIIEKRAGKLLGAMRFDSEIDVMRFGMHVVVHVSRQTVTMNDIQRGFIHMFTTTNNNDNFLVLPVNCIVAPIGRFHNFGGKNNEHFVALPKRLWGNYFNEKIAI